MIVFLPEVVFDEEQNVGSFWSKFLTACRLDVVALTHGLFRNSTIVKSSKSDNKFVPIDVNKLSLKFIDFKCLVLEKTSLSKLEISLPDAMKTWSFENCCMSLNESVCKLVLVHSRAIRFGKNSAILLGRFSLFWFFKDKQFTNLLVLNHILFPSTPVKCVSFLYSTFVTSHW